MASAASAVQEEFQLKFQNWLADKLGKLNDEESDISMVSNYVFSTLEEDTSDDEKKEAISPFIRELKQEMSDEEEQQLLNEILECWNNMRLEYKEKSEIEKVNRKNESELNPTETIQIMMNKHKNQLVEVKKVILRKKQPLQYYNENESDDDDSAAKKGGDDLFSNTNLQDAQHRDKANREKMAETSQKQREQAKKALIEQKEREIEKKKKAQQKAAKVERKR